MTTTVPTVAELLEERRRHVYDLLLAICTVCAQTRQAKRPRNRDWSTQTGDLKCAACGTVTRHALVHGSSHDEHTWALAYGMPDDYGNVHSTEFMDRARAGMKRNPQLSHIWYSSVEEKAIAAGAPMMRTLCGELVPTPANADETNSVPKTPLDPIAYGQSRHRREFDSDGWRIMECVNCLRVHNHGEAVRRRKQLAELMTTALAELLDPPRAGIYDDHSAALIDALRAVHGEDAK